MPISRSELAEAGVTEVHAGKLVDLFDSLAIDDTISDDEALSRIEPYVGVRQEGVMFALQLREGLVLTHLDEAAAKLTDEEPTEKHALHLVEGFVAAVSHPVTGVVGPRGAIRPLSVTEDADLVAFDASMKAAQFAFLGWVGQKLMDMVNGLKRKRRNRRFDRGFRDDIPVVVAEGDSWVLYPWKLRDVAEHLADDLNVYSVGAAGDELVHMIDRKQHLRAIAKLTKDGRRPEALLFSGGGNDVLGPPFKRMLRDYTGGYDPGQNPERFVHLTCDEGEDCLENELRRVSGYYERLFDQMAAEHPRITVYVHGYDYAEPGGNGEPVEALPFNWIFSYGDWLSETLRLRGIYLEEDQDAIIRLLIDNYNDRIRRLADVRAEAGENVRYVDVRGSVGSDWANEIHPNTAGFGRVAAHFKSAILPTS
jgi:hypothetical protein